MAERGRGAGEKAVPEKVPPRAPSTRAPSAGAPSAAKREGEANAVALRVALGQPAAAAPPSRAALAEQARRELEDAPSAPPAGDGGMRQKVGSALGRDFSGVRLHTGPEAAARTEAVGAHAAAQGGDVWFAPGRYRPDRPLGRALIAHELVHAAQQGAAPLLADQEEEHDAVQSELPGLTPAPPGTLSLFACGGSSGPTEAELAEEEARKKAEEEAAAEAARKKASEAPIPDPKNHATFEAWLAAFPPHYGSSRDRVITGQADPALQALIAPLVGVQPDCADVSMILRHYWLKAHGKNATIKAGKKTYTIGAGMSDADLRSCLVDTGSIHFQNEPKALRYVKFYKAGGARATNLKQLIGLGLKAGDVLVWKRLASVSGNFEGHVQTVQNVDVAGQAITMVQGNMSGGVGVGALQQRKQTFMELTGVADGDGPIKDAPEESFYGAGPWAE